MRGAESPTYTYVGALVDELVRSGVRHLCLCPGSRSTPLALTAASHPGLRVWTLVDERSCGFFALGMARMQRAPVALLSTSGTAAANFLPAVIEAAYGRVPLIVLTADRPPELRDCGASQTIVQVRLYGAHAKWFVDVAVPEATDALVRYARSLACQAVAEATAVPAGPVHLNLPLREPLVPTVDPVDQPADDGRAVAWAAGRDDGHPFTTVRRAEPLPDPDLVCALADDLQRRPKGVIVCGPQDDPALPEAICRLGAVLEYPILADPLSQVRCGAHDRSHVVDSYDALLRVGALAPSLTPDIILRVGGIPASKPLLGYLERHGRIGQTVIDGGGGWLDPGRLASQVVHADPRRLCEGVTAEIDRRRAAGSARPHPKLERGEGRAPTPWVAMWQRLAARTRQAITERLGRIHEPFEGKVFAELAELLPDGATLYVGNSMPVRDLDTFFPGSPRTIRVLGNRGASGIDGVVSSALGAAAVGRPPVVLVLGDLAFYHDLNGLLAAKLHRLSATIVLLNNDGGGIFSFMPQADYPEHFEALFGTPTGLDFRVAADLYGAAFARPQTWDAFGTCVREGLTSPGLGIVEVRTARDRNVVLHREVWVEVERALAGDRSTLAPGSVH